MDSSSSDTILYLKYLNIIFLSPVIVIGVIGNCLSMLTWSRGCYRDTSTAALLAALALADTIVLTIPALERWLYRVIYFMIRNDNIVTCKIWAFLSYFGPTISSWIIVFITVERFVSIWFPRKVCTRLKVILILLLMVLIFAALYMPLMISAKLFKYENTGDMSDVNSTNMTSYIIRCDVPRNDTFYDVYFPVWMWLDLVFLFVVPFVLIVVGNILIIYQLYKSRTILLEGERFLSNRFSFTIRAIAVSITFLICLLPVTSYQVITVYTELTLPLYAGDIIHILLYAKSAFNFLLYCAIGSGFRTSLKSLFTNPFIRKREQQEDVDSSINQTQNTRF